MKAALGQPKRDPRVVAISIAVHGLVALGLAAITFHYPIEELFRRDPVRPVEPIRYVQVAPAPRTAAAGPRSSTATPSAALAPAPRRALPPTSSIPLGLPAANATPTDVVGISARPVTADTGRARGIAYGVRPGIPDPRLATNPFQMGVAPETDGMKAERVLSQIYLQYLDSTRAQMASGRRAPGDWSWGGDNGDKWGWDTKGIHIGGVTIPNVVLAALPLNFGPGGRNVNALTDMRTDAFMRSDIQLHANAMSEEEFRTAVKRIRQRLDRERAERKAREQDDRSKKQPPCCG